MRHMLLHRLSRDLRVGRVSTGLAELIGTIIAAASGIWRCRRKQGRQRASCNGLEQKPQERPEKTLSAAATGAVVQQIRTRYPRMRCDTGNIPARLFASPLQFESKHQTCQLRLTIDRHGLVAPLRLQIVEVDRDIGASHGNAGKRHDAWGVCTH